MPAVKIELSKGKDFQTIIKIRDVVLDSVVESLQLPANDRNIRIQEYEPELFKMKEPYKILVELTMFNGRTKETKKKLFQSIVNMLEENNLFLKEQVFIILNEQPLENWGVRGGIPADEINLDFKVNI